MPGCFEVFLLIIFHVFGAFLFVCFIAGRFLFCFLSSLSYALCHPICAACAAAAAAAAAAAELNPKAAS